MPYITIYKLIVLYIYIIIYIYSSYNILYRIMLYIYNYIYIIIYILKLPGQSQLSKLSPHNYSLWNGLSALQT